MVTKLDVLKATRTRALQALSHRIEVILTFTDEISPRKLKVSTQLLENAWNEFKSANGDLDGLISDDVALAQFTQETFNTEDRYIEAKTLLEELAEIEADDSSSANTTRNNSSDHEDTGTNVQLSRLIIKPFSGKYEDWSEFKDIFKSCIIKNARLPDVQKLHQLKSLLSDEPAKLIKNLKMRDNNFEIAWNTLNDHYDNQNKVVWGYLQRFFEIPTISAGTATAAELQHIIITTTDLLTSLTDFDIDTSSWDTIIIYILTQKLDTTTINYWHEERKAKKTIPTFKQFRTFLETRQNVSESKEGRRRSTSMSATSTPKVSSHKPTTKPFSKNLLNQTTIVKCELCERDHRTYQCSRLINASYEKRLELVRSKKLCENCLYPHETEKCLSKYTCRACNDKHHTLLHPLPKTLHTKLADVEEGEEGNDPEYDSDDGACGSAHNNEIQEDESVHVNLYNHMVSKSSMLATALVPVFTRTGATILLRTLFDQGSETSLLTSSAHQLLNTKRTIENIPVVAVGNTPTGVIKYGTNIVIGSLYDNNYRYSVKTLITKIITSVNPKPGSNLGNWSHIQNLPLADPKYFESGQIDLLLGVKEMAELLLPGLIKGDVNTPVAQQTKIGWVLSGTCGTRPAYVRCNLSKTAPEDQTLSDLLRAFWTIEEVGTAPIWSPDEQAAEDHFIKHVRRHNDGKLIVRLPFKSDPHDVNFLGNSYDAARSRFFQVEKKLMKNEKHYHEYRKCMNEYIELGHMRPVTLEERHSGRGYFLPHHGVVKESSETTKLRVVFDASCKSSNGRSLNDQLYVGPTIQNDLLTLLIQWRKFKIAFTGDIEKMYRQVWVDSNDTKFQRIVWRNSNTEPLQDYILQTVTFGTSSAPFQAIRCLFKVADDIKQTEPIIADQIKENFYVDDFLGTAETVHKAIETREKIQSIMKGYGLNLRKWKSNSIEFLETVSPAIQSDSLEHTFDSPCKALGLYWHPRNDSFYFKLEFDNDKPAFTKRRILSETAKIFDPLGWLAPCTVRAKILMQGLWLLPIKWDDKVPKDIEVQWCKFRSQLTECANIKIPRWTGYSSKNQNTTIHGFADASEEAYAAVVYLCTESNEKIHTSLIAAKTKVAPLKKLTIPHLELSAARLLAELVNKVQDALRINDVSITAWTDSMVVLGWLTAPPHRWKTFVANRVSQIQETISPECWRHVPTKLNPADCASRGLFWNELQSHELWWNGPDFLRQKRENWPKRHESEQKVVLPDMRKPKKVLQVHVDHDYHQILSRFSSFRTLLHATAYCLRWRHRKTETFVSKILSVEEIERARVKWLKMVQRTYFPREVSTLRSNPTRPMPRNSPITALNPKLDEQELLRVEGRLEEASLSRDQKEPIILPKAGHLTELIVRDAHLKTFHGGNQLTLRRLRQQYWVIQGRNTVKVHLHNCTVCFRYRKQVSQQLMGNLPKFRVNECRPFTYTGVDFAGYFDIKTSARRNAPFAKAYISVFICLTTKAMHLEVVSSLSTEAFLLAFKRFIARKLIPRHMYSDRGTNFIGAKNELPRLFQNAKSEQIKEVREVLLKDQIEWHMIPAHAPHFGGLWEAGVKSTKYHLKRVLGDAKLNFEEFTTVVAQIESCLNSRPLYPQSEDPKDDQILTPNHLIFAYDTSTLPEPCSEEIPARTVNRYQLLRRLHTSFWRKWSEEYLTRLMHRSKWTKREENLRPNQIVLIREDNLPPTKWLYGRIVKVHPGRDGLVRVADVKCKNAVLSRPIHKLCLLPIVDNKTETESVSSN